MRAKLTDIKRRDTATNHQYILPLVAVGLTILLGVDEAVGKGGFQFPEAWNIRDAWHALSSN